MKDIFRINPNQLVETGIQQVDFDPSLVKRYEDKEYIGDWSNDGEYVITYMYENEYLAKMMYDLGYSLNWNNELPFNNNQQSNYRKDRMGIRFKRMSCVKLRKKRNSSGYSENSLKQHEEAKEKLKLKYDVDSVTNLYRRLIEDFNNFYREEQIKQVSKAFGNVYSWNVDDYEEIKVLTKEIEALEKKASELRQKRFDKRCELVVSYVESEEENIANDFVQPILQEVNKCKDEGYKSPFLRRF